MIYRKKAEETFSERIALKPAILFKTYEIIYGARPTSEDLKSMFKEVYDGIEYDTVILKEFEDSYLIKFEIIEGSKIFTVSKLIYPEVEFIDGDTPFKLEKLVSFDNTVGNIISAFYDLDIILEFKDVWYFPDCITDKLYDHFNKFPILKTQYSK